MTTMVRRGFLQGIVAAFFAPEPIKAPVVKVLAHGLYGVQGRRGPSVITPYWMMLNSVYGKRGVEVTRAARFDYEVARDLVFGARSMR